jgi:hypothetical protein
MFKNNTRQKRHKIKKYTAQSVFAFLSLLLIPIYTLIFGTKENPWENTLSGIGNAFDHKLSFIIWGIVTGMAILYHSLYLFEKMDFSDKRARRYLISSQAFLLFTVLTPALKSVFPVWHFIHVMFSGLFALFLIIAIILFVNYLSKSNQKLSKTAFILLLSCVGVSILALFFMGLNGVVEILFFIGITVFLAVLGFILDRLRKQKENWEARPGEAQIDKQHPGL